jgi:hypothetical protein
MARITINLDPLIAAKVKGLAQKDRRSVSSYILRLLETDTAQSAGVIQAAAELQSLGADPIIALRDKISEVQRDDYIAHLSRPTPSHH